MRIGLVAVLGLFTASALIVSGCGQKDAKTDASGSGKQVAQVTDQDKEVSGAEKEEEAHEGWWCNEHGIPEEICALCSSKVAADFKKKGDWCEKHDRPDSQCFICHPELEARFAAQYEAKEGKKPPKPEKEAYETES